MTSPRSVRTHGTVLLGLLLTAVAPPLHAFLQGGQAPAAQERVIRVPGGTVTVTREGDMDHVVVRSSSGDLQSDSWCALDDGSYDEYAAFFAELRRAVTQDTAAAVAGLTRFPLGVNGPKRRVIANSARFIAGYGDVFTPTIVDKLAHAPAGVVFCHEGSAMVADGTVWAHKADGVVKLEVVNQ